MAIEQQMNMLARGGLDDDGMSRDPVSGNTIPAGSMANEVRDDVDAKLSDGEYVVPANVVRFFGVKFFEDLRTQAMQGLGTMEANGRIGGEPMPSDMPMQDQMAGSPEELSEQDMAMLQNIMNEGGDVRGYAHGGYHDPVNDPQPIPQSFPSSVYPLTQYATPGASTVLSNLNPNLPPSAITATPDNLPLETNNPEFRFVTMVNPANGNIQVVQFKGDVPVDANAYNQLINSGFFVQGSPELAAYNQQQNEDNIESDRQMGGDKPKSIEDLLQSTVYGSINLGPSANILGSVIDKAFPTTSNQEIIDYIIKNGEFPPSGRGLRDETQPRMGNGEYPFQYHTEGPLAGTIKRDNSSPRNVAKEQVAYLKEAMRLQKQNTKKGKINYKAYRASLIKNNLLIKSGLTTKAVSYKDWYKDWDGKTKSKSTATVDGGGGPSSVITPTYGDVTTPKAVAASEAAGKAFTTSAEAKSKAGFMNEGNDNNNNNDNDNRPVGSTGTSAVEANVSGPTGENVSDQDKEVKDIKDYGYREDAGFGLMNKGGLLKKPTKKKKTKKY